MGGYLSQHSAGDCLEVSVGVVPEKAKTARNAKKAAGKVLREEGLGRRVPGRSSESEAGLHNQVIPRQTTCRDICMCI